MRSNDGVVSLGDAVRRNRGLNAVSIFVPMAITAFALATYRLLTPTSTTLAAFLVMFFLSIVGVGIGLHRYFVHRSYKTSAVMRLLLGVLGSWVFQGPIARWVADHRRHHRYSDEILDPHSPYKWWNGEFTAPWRGWLHAHFLWMLTGFVSDESFYAKDILDDSVSRWCTQMYWPLALSSLALPALIVFVVTRDSRETLLAFLWAGGVRVTLLQQLTWSVNSFGHMFGTRVLGASDQARDNLLLTVLLFGEGLHSFHHRHQAAAINEPAALDLGGWVIRLLEALGIVWGVKRRPAPAPLITARKG